MSEALEEPHRKRAKLSDTHHAPGPLAAMDHTSLDYLFNDSENSIPSAIESPGGALPLKLEDDLLEQEISRALASISEYDTQAHTTQAHTPPTPAGTQASAHRTHSHSNTSTSTATSSPVDLSPFGTPNTISSTSDAGHDMEEKHAVLVPELHASIPPAEPHRAVAATAIHMSTVSSVKAKMLETSKFISTFTTLKATYLKLCKEFNYLLTKFNDNERVKVELIHENNELKKLLVQIITERELERKMDRKRTFSSTA